MVKPILFSVFLSATTLISLSQTTTITLQPGPLDGKDAEVFNCVPCGYDVGNFGTKKDFDAIGWTNNGAESNVRSLIQFDLSSIPQGATVVDARLSLYNNPTSTEGDHVTSILTPNKSVIQRITSNWDESTVTWNTQPTVSNLNKVKLSATTSSHQNKLNINVTALVRDMLLHPATSFGFRLKLTTEDEFRKLIFASSDNTNAAIRPRLVVTYTGPAPRIKNPENSNLKIDQTVNSDFSFEMSPNPAKDFINISADVNENCAASFEVFNLMGSLIYNRNINLREGANHFLIQTDSWTKGIYFVTIKTSKELITKKIIVE